MPHASIQIFFYAALWASWLLSAGGLYRQVQAADPEDPALLSGKALITRPAAGDRGGRAYKLVYVVKVPVNVYWAFKTDYENKALLTNIYITEQRFIRRRGKTVITENRYSFRKNAVFRWQTILSPHARRLDYSLLNPNACRQKFHYGYIRLEALGGYTKVTQVAYFDFRGAFFWVNNPWRGGMNHFLRYMAQWEQELVLRLKGRYDKCSGLQSDSSAGTGRSEFRE